METISKFFKEEQDYLYRKGEEKGREKEQFKVVTNLISELGLPDEQVARIAGVSVNFVKSVREGFNK